MDPPSFVGNPAGEQYKFGETGQRNGRGDPTAGRATKRELSSPVTAHSRRPPSHGRELTSPNAMNSVNPAAVRAQSGGAAPKRGGRRVRCRKRSRLLVRLRWCPTAAATFALVTTFSGAC